MELVAVRPDCVLTRVYIRSVGNLTVLFRLTQFSVVRIEPMHFLFVRPISAGERTKVAFVCNKRQLKGNNWLYSYQHVLHAAVISYIMFSFTRNLWHCMPCTLLICCKIHQNNLTIDVLKHFMILSISMAQTQFPGLEVSVCGRHLSAYIFFLFAQTEIKVLCFMFIKDQMFCQKNVPAWDSDTVWWSIEKSVFSMICKTAFWQLFFHFDTQICQAGFLISINKGSHDPH